jgi:hypothetical protein
MLARRDQHRSINGTGLSGNMRTPLERGIERLALNRKTTMVPHVGKAR